MAIANSTRRSARNEDVLSFHKGSGQYCKTVNGRRYYLGRDHDEALRTWHRCKADFRIGIDPRREEHRGGLTLKDAANLFLSAKDARVKTGELKPKSFRGYLDTCQRFVSYFGEDRDANSFQPEHFNLYKTAIFCRRTSPITVGNEIGVIRQLFLWLHENRHIDKPHFGPEFKKAGKKAVTRHLRQKGDRTLNPNEILSAINELGVHYRAAALLGINCGFGPTDIAELPRSAVNYDAAEINYPRPKTEEERRCPLWPETIDALMLSERFRPKTAEADRFFQLADGAMARKFTGALRAAKAYREGQTSFYSLRHTLATIARKAKDDAALRVIMGHTDDTVLDLHYTHDFPRERLDVVSDHVRGWLFGSRKPECQTEQAGYSRLTPVAFISPKELAGG